MEYEAYFWIPGMPDADEWMREYLSRGGPLPEPRLDIPTVPQPSRTLRRQEMLTRVVRLVAELGSLEEDDAPASRVGKSNNHGTRLAYAESLVRAALGYRALLKDEGP